MKTSAMHGESGYERVANDAYWTPGWCTQTVLDRVEFPPMIWEPACGEGHICRVLQVCRLSFVGSDLVDHGYGETGIDFLAAEKMPPGCTSIMTNPPYALAEAFIRKALELTKPHQGRVAMLLRNEYDCAARRRDLFEHPAFYKKIVLTKRPRWFDKETERIYKSSSPRHNFAWFVWCWNWRDAPIIEWAP